MGRRRIEPGPGQESVWDYPRPPKLENSDKRVKVVFGGVTLAYTTRAKRVLETSHPPVFYIPPDDIRMEHLRLAEGTFTVVGLLRRSLVLSRVVPVPGVGKVSGDWFVVCGHPARGPVGLPIRSGDRSYRVTRACGIAGPTGVRGLESRSSGR